MRKIYTFLLICSFLVADSYIYKFSSSGIPKTRTSSATGIVEIYTNLHKIKANEHILHKIHSFGYSDMTYKDFLEDVRTQSIQNYSLALKTIAMSG